MDLKKENSILRSVPRIFLRDERKERSVGIFRIEKRVRRGEENLLFRKRVKSGLEAPENVGNVERQDTSGPNVLLERKTRNG